MASRSFGARGVRFRTVACILTAACLWLPCPPGSAEESTAAAPAETLGRVSFATSCDPSVQTAFEHSVALLHSFWWQAGERSFRQVLERDPHCAIATWGIAAILLGNTFSTGPSAEAVQRAREAIERGRAIGAGTPRERAYIEAIASFYEAAESSQAARMKALAAAFGKLAQRYPEDDEAQIFHALYLTSTQQPSDKSFAAALEGAQILEVQFARHPEHPGAAHYLIHSYDFPPIADKGLPAARRYAAIAPSAPHAQHMPSHIFTRVGAWQDSARANERSAEIAAAQNETADRLHAMDYLVYAYEQLGRDKEAALIVGKAAGLTGTEARAVGVSYALAAIPARYAVERAAWKEAAQLEVHQSAFRFTEALTHFGRALGSARSGNPAAAEEELTEITRIADALKAANNAYWATEVEVQRLSVAAWVAYARDRRDDALALMRLAADMEDRSEKAAVSPGRLVPARELLGEMLLEIGRPAEALSEFERSQVRDPNRFRGLYGAAQAASRAGHRDKARYYFERLIVLTGADSARPEAAQARQYLSGT